MECLLLCPLATQLYGRWPGFDSSVLVAKQVFQWLLDLVGTLPTSAHFTLVGTAH